MTTKSIVSAQFSTAASNKPEPSAEADPSLAEDELLDETISAAAIEAEIFGVSTGRGKAWVQEAIKSRANFAQRLPGTAELTIGNGPGSLGNLTPEERKRKADEESAEWTDVLAEIGERKREERSREQQQWDETVHSFAGQELTGKEWAELAESMKKGGKGHDWLIEYFMAKGSTPEQAEQKAKDMELMASGMSKPESERTPEEKEAIEKGKNNPETEDAFKKYREAQSSGFPPLSAENAAASRSDQKTSVDTGNEALDVDSQPAIRQAAELHDAGGQQSSQASTLTEGVVIPALVDRQAKLTPDTTPNLGEQLFASAPDLGEHHKAALAATEPLDAKKPVQVAAAPQPNASAGLDV